jgi:hypothetical protein
MTLEEKIKESEAEINRLERELRAEKEVLVNFKLDEVSLKYGVQYGSVCVSTRTGEEFKVFEILCEFGRPWLNGVKRKRNGEWSEVVHNFFSDWKPKEG